MRRDAFVEKSRGIFLPLELSCFFTDNALKAGLHGIFERNESSFIIPHKINARVEALAMIDGAVYVLSPS
ncbi:MAG: hypothetical protein A3D92_07770 [Bacteroidetes bacterium RIFCSPHIGHO2_02_FULL_44_7]|nr:MAG: hypothetical protein A3D92_07770 [Bacteroidetes bacterium RIFCSPHIGHO2_02_FULL_44_7]